MGKSGRARGGCAHLSSGETAISGSQVVSKDSCENLRSDRDKRAQTTHCGLTPTTDAGLDPPLRKKMWRGAEAGEARLLPLVAPLQAGRGARWSAAGGLLRRHRDRSAPSWILPAASQWEPPTARR